MSGTEGQSEGQQRTAALIEPSVLKELTENDREPTLRGLISLSADWLLKKSALARMREKATPQHYPYTNMLDEQPLCLDLARIETRMWDLVLAYRKDHWGYTW